MEFVTIKEFSILANITTQAIYKRIGQQDSALQPYLKFDGKYKLISTEALKLFADEQSGENNTSVEKKPEKPAVEKKPEPVQKPKPAAPVPEPIPSPAAPAVISAETQLLNHTTNKLVTSLENHIDDLKKEIETLRSELAEKNLQLSNLNERLANEQELHRHNQLLLVSTQESDSEKEKESEKQVGFFKKIFGK